MNFQMSVLYVPISVVRTMGIKMCTTTSGFCTYVSVIWLQLSALLYPLNQVWGPLLAALSTICFSLSASCRWGTMGHHRIQVRL